METGLARTSDPWTSQLAAGAVPVKQIEQLVLGAIASSGLRGATADEVEQVIHRCHPGIRSNAITPRFRPLLNKGLIVETGETRPGWSGRSQRVVRVK